MQYSEPGKFDQIKSIKILVNERSGNGDIIKNLQLNMPSRHGHNFRSENNSPVETNRDKGGGLMWNAKKIRSNNAELANMSTQNLKINFSKFLDQPNQESVPLNDSILLSQRQQNHLRSTSLNYGDLKGITAATTTNNSSYINSKQFLKKQMLLDSSNPPKFPSIYENFLSQNPLNGIMSNRRSNHRSKLEQSSIIFELPSHQKVLPPFQDSALQEAKKKFLQTSLRKMQTKTSLDKQSPNFPKLSGFENSIINESSEDPLNNTGLNFNLTKNHGSFNEMNTTVNIIQESQIKNSFEKINRSMDGDATGKNKYRWNLLGNLDFLDGENANEYDLQLPKYDPVCYCDDNIENCIKEHGSINGIMDLIRDQFNQVQQLNINVDTEYEYLDTSLKKIVFLRGHTFHDSIMQVIRQKKTEIQDLKNEVSKLIILKKDNEILTMKVKNLEEDQEYLKNKYNDMKQHKALNEKLEKLVKDLQLKIQKQENDYDSLRNRKDEVNKKLKHQYQKMVEEQQKNQGYVEKIEKLEFTLKKITTENDNYKKYIQSTALDIDNRQTNIVQKGKIILDQDFKSNNPNILSMEMGQLEAQLNSLSMNRYLAIASLDVRLGRDVVGLELLKQQEEQIKTFDLDSITRDMQEKQ